MGRDTRFPTFTEVVAALRGNLAALPGQLQLESARALAAPKIRMLEEFLRAVDQEARGALF